MRLLKLAAAAAAAAALFALPTAASATTFPATTSAQITTAINSADANPGSDVVTIAPGEYTITGTTFPQLAPSPTNTLTIVGAGVGQTVLNGSDANAVITLQLPNDLSLISGFTLNASLTGAFASGILQYVGKIQNFEVNQDGASGSSDAGLSLTSDTSVTDGKITTLGSTRAIVGNGIDLKARRLTLVGSGGGWGVILEGNGDSLLSRVKISNYQTGIMIENGAVEFEDSSIDLGALNSALGVYSRDQNVGASAINFDGSRNTIVGTGAGQVGVHIGTQEAGDTVDGGFKDNAIYLADASSTAYTCSGTGLTVFAIGTAYRGALYSSCSPTYFNVSVELTSSPFVDLAAHDLRLPVGSPLVDAGLSTASSTGGLDLAGANRVVDGNGDGTATVDIGAYEYQLPVPPGTGGGGTVIPITTPIPLAVAKVIAKPKKAFKIGKKGFSVVKKGSPTFSLQFTDAASAKFTIAKKKGTKTLKVSPGTSKFTFGGTWNKKKLKAGTYKVTVTPLSAAGVPGAPVTVTVKLKN